MERTISLCRLLPGQIAVISRVGAQPHLLRRLQQFGMLEGTRIRCLRVCPLGDPTLYSIRGAALALRRRDAEQILVLARSGREVGENDA